MAILLSPYLGNMLQTHRVKVEVRFSGLTAVLATGSVGVDLLTLLDGKTPDPASVTGLAPFFKLSDHKFHAFPVDSILSVKVNIIGSWSGSTSNRTMLLDFVGSTGNQLSKSRDSSVPPPDTLSFITFFSVDKAGNLATNGAQMKLYSYGGDFTINEIVLIAEQVVPLYMNSI